MPKTTNGNKKGITHTQNNLKRIPKREEWVTVCGSSYPYCLLDVKSERYKNKKRSDSSKLDGLSGRRFKQQV